MKPAEIVELLKENVCVIKFEKVNGEKRTMKCTLLEDMIPEASKVIHPAETRYPQLSELDSAIEPHPEKDRTVISVYDLENNGWRSFRINFLESIEKVEKV